MAKISKLPEDMAILNQALRDLDDLKQQVANQLALINALRKKVGI